jgi:hypothetical protein
MNSVVRVPLNASPEQAERLAELQRGFAEVCNALAPLVRSTRTWNRVALHHMAYRDLRQRFPAMGSQMVCNAIYSVSRTARAVFQSPGSPFHLSRLGTGPLPRLSFGANAPVYFDRHTLSLKAGQLSMFTLDGRMRFQLNLAPEVEQRFRHDKLREIVLGRQAATGWELHFRFGDAPADAGVEADDDRAGSAGAAADGVPHAAAPGHPAAPDLPEYVLVLQDDAAADPAPPVLPGASLPHPAPPAVPGPSLR